ncbi:MAG: site-specific integrase [Planctomycetaceae bacterium]|nr:site-specific integrase [Planctomycetaceae bacterium]
MASLYKKSTTATDPKSGRKVKRKSAKWWGKYRDPASGKVKWVSLATDKAASQAMLNRLVTRAENLAAGRLDPSDEHQRRPLTQHLTDFTKNLSDRGNTTDHIKSTTQRVQDVLMGCRFTFINDISASRVQSFLADLRAGGRALATHDETLSKRPTSIANANHYLRAMKMFTRWLVKDRRTDDDRLAHLSYQNVETDRRRVRRPLTIDELSRLIETTEAGPERLCLSGPDRAALYTLAAFTGFRRNELGSITIDSFDFASVPATVTIEAAYAKNRRRDMIPLQTDAAERLQRWLASKGKLNHRRPLFNVTNAHTATMLQADLRAAGIEPIDEAGRVVDFHALRGTFISNLAKAGVSLTMAQKLARHSDPKLTANVYTVLGVLDHAAAVESLPMIVTGPAPHTEAATMRATGTDGRIDERIIDVSVVPSVVPCGAQISALRLASIPTDLASNCIETGSRITTSINDLTPGGTEGYSVDLRHVASLCSEVPEVGLEPTHSCEYWILSATRMLDQNLNTL